MNATTTREVLRARRLSVIEPAYAAGMLATMHSAAGHKVQAELVAVIDELGLHKHLCSVGGCLVARGVA